MTSSGLIAASQAAKILGISQRQVARRVAKGQLNAELQLPGERGAYLFDEEYVRALANDQEVAS